MNHTKGASLGLDTCLKICISLSNFRDIFLLPGQYGYSYCTTPQASRGNNKKKPVTEENKGVFVWEVQNAFHKAQRSHLSLYGKRDRVLVNSSQVRPSLERCLYSENPFSSSEFKTLDAPVCLGPFSLAVAGTVLVLGFNMFFLFDSREIERKKDRK